MQQEAHTFGQFPLNRKISGQKNYLKNQILTNCKLQEEEENTSELYSETKTKGGYLLSKYIIKLLCAFLTHTVC